MMILRAAVAALLLSGGAQAQCIEWTPVFIGQRPEFPPHRPELPECLRSYEITGAHTCPDHVISVYALAVQLYVQDLREYAHAAEQFARLATIYADNVAEYVSCRERRLRDELTPVEPSGDAEAARTLR